MKGEGEVEREGGRLREGKSERDNGEREKK